MANKIKVTLLKSGINRKAEHKATIKGLGLSRPGQSRVVIDNASVRGMIRAVSHMVKIEPSA